MSCQNGMKQIKTTVNIASLVLTLTHSNNVRGGLFQQILKVSMPLPEESK